MSWLAPRNVDYLADVERRNLVFDARVRSSYRLIDDFSQLPRRVGTLDRGDAIGSVNRVKKRAHEDAK